MTAARRTRLLGGPWLEAALVLAGAVLVALGAGSARSGSAMALLPLDVAVLALAGALVALAAGSEAPVRRFAATAGVLLVLVAVPFTRIPSGGEVTASVTVAFLLLGGLGLRGARPRVGAIGVAGGALLVVLAVVTALSPDRFALLRLVPFLVAVVPLFLLLAGSDAATRMRTLRFVVVLGVAESLLAIAEPLLGSPQLWSAAKITAAGVPKGLPNPLLPELLRSQGTLGHPLALGVLLLVAFALLVRDAAGIRRGVRVALGALLLVGLLASGSRSSIVVAVLLAVVLLPRWRLGRRAIAAAVGGVVVVVVALLAAVPVLTGWAASGSTTHRLGALDAVPGLLHQPLPQLLLGNGWASTDRMFALGLLQDDGLKAVDEQFVLTLSQGGLLALALLLAVVVLALIRSDRRVLPAAIAIVATMLVFDVLAWPSAAALAAVVAGAAGARRPTSSRGAAPAPQERRAYSR